MGRYQFLGGLLVSVLFLLSLHRVAVAADSSSLYIVNEEGIPVREEANDDSEVVFRLHKGEVIRLEASPNKSWATIRARNNVGKEVAFAVRFFNRRFTSLGSTTTGLPGKMDLGARTTGNIYEDPSYSWAECKEVKSLCIAEPTRDAKIQILESAIVETVEPVQNELKWQNFYFVRYNYNEKIPRSKQTRPIVGEGWILAEDVSLPKTVKPTEQQKKANQAADRKLDEIERAELKARAEERREQFEDIVIAVEQYVGRCELPKIGSPPPIPKNKSIYDAYLMPYWKNMEGLSLHGKHIDSMQMRAIDGLARTIWSEIASCWKRAPQYLMAVAAIARNRARTCDQADAAQKACPFVGKNDNEANKPNMLKILLADKQFSPWNAYEAHGRVNKSLKHVLCPPAKQNAPYYTGQVPTEGELAIWRDAVRYAVMAVAYPEEFDRQTSSMKGLFFFTSGKGYFHGFSQVTPDLEGVALDRPQCLEFWINPKRASY